jgi:hypothetical protein
MQRSFSNVSINSIDSTHSLDSTNSFGSTSSFDSSQTLQSLPSLYSVPSASRNVKLKKDLTSMRQQIENNCRKTVRRKKKKKGLDNLIVYYNDWDRWLRKHQKYTIVGGLSEGEFKILFTWFSNQMKNNPDDVRGIKVANVVDDFMESGLYADRAEAYSFVCKIDTKRNGEVTFDNFMAAMQDTKDVSQLNFLKKFVKNITPYNKSHGRQKTRACTSYASSRTFKPANSRAFSPTAFCSRGSNNATTSPLRKQSERNPKTNSRIPLSPVQIARKKNGHGHDDTHFPFLPSPITKKKSITEIIL